MAERQVAAGEPHYQCKSCEGEFEAGMFYASNLATCKECVKVRVRENRAENIDYYRSYDRMRYREDDVRAAHCQAMGKASSPEKRAEKQRQRRRADPEKYQARNAVANALRDGKMVREHNCFFCGGDHRVQAHHHDYSRPLDVYWLCSGCHGKLHAINGDFHRPKPF